MADTSELLKKKDAIKQQLAAQEYKSLASVIFKGTGRLVQKITRSPEPMTALWYNGIVIALVTLLIGCIVSLVLGESPTPEMMLLAVWGMGLGVLVMIQSTLATGWLLTTLQNSTVDAIDSMDDLEHLHRWLTSTFQLKKQFVFSLFTGLVVGSSAPLFWAAIKGGFTGFGPLVGVILIWFQAGLGWYFVLPVLAWMYQLRHYRLNLYHADPSNSAAVDHISDMMSEMVYSGAILAAIFTLGLIYFELLTPTVSILFLLLGSWGPLIIIFFTTQYALAKIISRAKWKTLSQFQTKIEQLQALENIPSEETLSHLNQLMDYHDRIRATRNSALDFRAGFNFLNSLLLPLLAFLLANVDKIFAFFE